MGGWGFLLLLLLGWLGWTVSWLSAVMGTFLFGMGRYVRWSEP